MSKKGKKGGFLDVWKEIKENPECRTKETTALADKLEFVLRDYAVGRYAGYFNGQGTLEISNPLTVFEFESLQNEVLQNAVLMMVIFLVYSKMFKRERRMALIIDGSMETTKT